MVSPTTDQQVGPGHRGDVEPRLEPQDAEGGRDEALRDDRRRQRARALVGHEQMPGGPPHRLDHRGEPQDRDRGAQLGGVVEERQDDERQADRGHKDHELDRDDVGGQRAGARPVGRHLAQQPPIEPQVDRDQDDRRKGEREHEDAQPVLAERPPDHGEQNEAGELADDLPVGPDQRGGRRSASASPASAAARRSRPRPAQAIDRLAARWPNLTLVHTPVHAS
jgi:hypothetical protein